MSGASHAALTASLLADADRALAAVGRGGAELSLVLVDDPTIHELNARWRDRDAPTDVLSFPSGGPIGLPVDVLGDVVISVDTARRQAAERGHPLDVELRVLLAHGLAHLLGHDHDEPAMAARMARTEAALLEAIFAGAPPAGLVAQALAAETEP